MNKPLFIANAATASRTSTKVDAGIGSHPLMKLRHFQSFLEPVLKGAVGGLQFVHKLHAGHTRWHPALCNMN